MSSSVSIETTPTQLTEDQKLALEDLERWWVSKKGEHLISGGAGTGKTTLIAHWIQSHSNLKIAILCPTNKAASVLKKKLTFNADVYTIHAILGLVIQEKGGQYKMKGVRVTRDSEKSTLDTGNSKFDTSQYQLIIVDEVSILSKDMECRLREKASQIKAKILWVGDSCQLPPPGQKASNVFNCGSSSILEQVMRYDAGVLKIAEHLRQLINVFDTQKPTLRSIIDKQLVLDPDLHNVELISANEWYEKLKDTVASENIEFKILAHKNDKVCHYNELIRSIKGIANKPFADGEQLISLRRNNYFKYVNRTNKVANFVNGEIVSILSSHFSTSRLCDPFKDKEIDIFDAKELVEFTLNFHKMSNFTVEVWDTTVQSLDRDLQWTVSFIDPRNNDKMIQVMNRSITLQEELKDLTAILYCIDGLISGIIPKVQDPSILEIAQEALTYLEQAYPDALYSVSSKLQSNCKALYSAYKEWQNLSFLTYHWAYNYALTVYKSQGSGFDVVFIDGLDVYNAPNWKKLLYVALTRAKQKVFIKE